MVELLQLNLKYNFLINRNLIPESSVGFISVIKRRRNTTNISIVRLVNNNSIVIEPMLSVSCSCC